MIHNRRELRSTQRWIRRFEHTPAAERGKKMSPGLRRLGRKSKERMLRDLKYQVRVYREAEHGQVRPAVLARLLSAEQNKGIPRIGDAMALLRVARKMTQEQLARRIGTRREVVARWEQDDYEGYTFDSLRKIFEALGCRLELFVRVAG